jgi:hypothetical protein
MAMATFMAHAIVKGGLLTIVLSLRNTPEPLNRLWAAMSTQPARTIKVEKTLGEQAFTVLLGYEQNYKLDLSAIANEKVTLVHIGKKPIILFNNTSTLTIEPFFTR